MDNLSLDSPFFAWTPITPLLRLLLAAIVGSAAGTIVLSAALLAAATAESSFRTGVDILTTVAPIAFLLGLAGALAGIVLIGLPVMLILRRIGLEGAGAYTLAGALVLLLPAGLVGLNDGWVLLGSIPYSVATALAFWRFFRMPALRKQREP